MSTDPDRLQADARRHLWMHFTRLGGFEHNDVPIFTRGSGVRLYDVHGRSYLDGLASLFVVQAGHGRADLAEAGRRQAEELAYYPIWSAAHPAAIELATRLADLAPGDLNRVFFTTGGSEAVESAWKLARAYFKAIGQPERTKVIARDLAYHGTTMGALAITGLAGAARPVRAGHARRRPRRQHQPLPLAVRRRTWLADDDRFAACLRRRHRGRHRGRRSRHGGGGVPRAPAEHGRMLRAAARVLRPGARHLRPPRRPARVRRGDLCLRPSRAWFGAERYGYQPDMLTFAKGVTSGYAPLAGRAVPRLPGRALPRTARPASPTASPSADTPSRARWRSPISTVLEDEGVDRARGRRWARPSALGSRPCATCPSWETSGATASSGPSSW